MRNQQMRYSRLGVSIILGLTFTLLAINIIHAQDPGDLDTTFNGTGVVTTSVGSAYDRAFPGVAVQPDGKIVAVGESGYLNYGATFAVVRYMITGSLDSAFNNTGIVTTPIGTYDTGRIDYPI